MLGPTDKALRFPHANPTQDKDPTNGYVSYVNRNLARSGGLINASATNGVYIGVDHTNVAQQPGRKSVRLESKKRYQHALVILDLAHMPDSTCGTWPAFWMLGSNWPNNGEIDIIEGVNTQATNQVALHTSSGCSIQDSGFTGTVETKNCDVNAQGQSNNAGCSITDKSKESFGNGLNQAGGGVYVTEWTGSAISVWFFPSKSIPKDITSGNPTPSTWGQPSAKFAGSCNIDKHFKDLQIVFDITFCGDWAGEQSLWSKSCPGKGTCNAWVQNNPTAFKDSYWLLNSLKVYQQSASTSGTGTGTSTAVNTGVTAGVNANINVGDINVNLDTNLGANLDTTVKRTAPYLRPGPRPVHRRARRHGHHHGLD